MASAVYVAGGVVVVALAFVIAIGRTEAAAGIHDWYNHFPDPKWRPAWLPWQFRPTARQAICITWILIVSGFILGSAFIAVGLGVDLGEGFG